VLGIVGALDVPDHPLLVECWRTLQKPQAPRWTRHPMDRPPERRGFPHDLRLSRPAPIPAAHAPCRGPRTRSRRRGTRPRRRHTTRGPRP
jgi:hypothetical protein